MSFFNLVETFDACCTFDEVNEVFDCGQPALWVLVTMPP